MTEERNIAVIKEELLDLNQVIARTAELERLYPDDFSVKLGMDSMRDRQKELQEEYARAYKNWHIETYDLTLSGTPVQNSTVAIGYLGSILSSFQDTITALVNRQLRGNQARGTIPEDIRKTAQMDAMLTLPGSFRVVMKGNSPTISESPPYKQALKQFNEMLECGANREQIKKVKDKVGTRTISHYKEFLKVIKTYQGEVKLYDRFGQDVFTEHRIDFIHANDIIEAIEMVEETREHEEAYTGTFTMVDQDNLKFRFASSGLDKRFECRFANTFSEKFQLTINNNQLYAVKLRVRTIYNPVTDSETQNYIVVEIHGEGLEEGVKPSQ